MDSQGTPKEKKKKKKSQQCPTWKTKGMQNSRPMAQRFPTIVSTNGNQCFAGMPCRYLAAACV